MDNKKSYIIDKVRKFADEGNLIWSVEESCCLCGFDIIFTTKDYKYRKRQTLQADYLVGRNWRMSADAHLQNIFANVIRAFGIESESNYNRTYYADYNSMFTINAVTSDFKRHRMPSIKNVIFNDPATIVFWSDGTKTIVKAQDGDVFDPEKGLAMAISKKALGNKGNYCEVFKKWLPEEEDEEITIDYLEKKLKELKQTIKEMYGSDKKDK